MRIALVGAGQIGAAHARRLVALDAVTELLVADGDPDRAAALAAISPKATHVSADDAFGAGVDGVVITANTSAHAPLLHRALDAGVAVFTEKPIALDVPTTRAVVEHAAARPDVPVQIGFQRRFDAGYLAARDAYRSGSLGFVHTVHATTYDVSPPPAAYIPTSGGLFKDCSIHDVDAIAWLTGRQAVSVWGTGSNMGADFFRDGGDVDTCNALITYDDEMTALVSATRYHGSGHDVRLELHGSADSRFVGLDDRAPLVTAEDPAALSWTPAEPYQTYHQRFEAAYRAELATFVDVAAGRAPSPCTPAEALEALYVAEACGISMREHRPVTIAEIRES
ncbi:Gfo/Idh/MocA family oxidoreductase [Actinotalea sp. M2MS4P-6]|uniref:Gfo/Idh/MocA family oxidoreductase n=1 Tax=Actinotalea sp. M2MS4P-6 TaxID=2983762 RepID=UPI0021E444C6|nr:Gfo/Idh/MocA family oxidoreductase [Actinotalea sp. M2MS4P-6]MCV2395033.1 Gfo/Idh/MocA family oxidoreductase [Actinotalea sp. M2MS4P-6]